MQPGKLLATAQEYHKNNRFPEARIGYLNVLAIDTENPQALHGLAILASQTGDFATAEQYIRQVIKLTPEDAHLYNTLAAILRAQGNTGGAEQEYLQALQLTPENPAALHGLGAISRDSGNFTAASDYFNRVTAVRPNDESAWSELGNAHWQSGRHTAATNAFRKAAKLRPDLAYTQENLGNALLEQGYHEEAVACLQRAAQTGKAHGTIIRAHTCIPAIMQTSAQVADTRSRLRRNLRELIDSNLTISDPLREIGRTNFFLAYHGENDLELQSLFAALYRKVCPDLDWCAPHCKNGGTTQSSDKIRIGFISSYFKNHSIARTSTGIIARLPRDRFHVVAIFIGPPSDEMAHAIAQAADETVVLPRNLQAARSILSGIMLDILYYQDIGMDVFTYFLAFSRLAPVQCTSFGHPVTSGIPNIDYYISTAAWEPEDAASHYSEKLVLLENATAVTCYDKPALPETLQSHEHFGLDPDRNIYLCPQALFKFHPDFDEILAGILQADPNGVLILLEGRHLNWSKLIMARLEPLIQNAGQRVQVLPAQHSIDFINLIALSDVMLDTIHFCGFNTSLEAFAAGTPVVTLPGKFMRSRHTAAYYRKMEMHECIASSAREYIEIAVRLGTDPEYRAAISNRISFTSAQLWGDQTVINDIAAAFVSMLEAQRS